MGRLLISAPATPARAAIRCAFCPAEVFPEFLDSAWAVDEAGRDICPACFDSGSWRLCDLCRVAYPDRDIGSYGEEGDIYACPDCAYSEPREEVR